MVTSTFNIYFLFFDLKIMNFVLEVFSDSLFALSQLVILFNSFSMVSTTGFY